MNCAQYFDLINSWCGTMACLSLGSEAPGVYGIPKRSPSDSLMINHDGTYTRVPPRGITSLGSPLDRSSGWLGFLGWQSCPRQRQSTDTDYSFPFSVALLASIPVLSARKEQINITPYCYSLRLCLYRHTIIFIHFKPRDIDLSLNALLVF